MRDENARALLVKQLGLLHSYAHEVMCLAESLKAKCDRAADHIVAGHETGSMPLPITDIADRAMRLQRAIGTVDVLVRLNHELETERYHALPS
jgi:hypothetical protein